MSRLEIILGAILAVSVLFNLGLIIYVRGSIVRLLSISEELGDLQQMIDSFANHLKAIYEMEMFYGDETLGSLVEHAASFGEYLEFLSRDFTFYPGDLLSGGTGAGTAADASKTDDQGVPLPDLFLKPGDKIEINSPQIGSLLSEVVPSK